MVFDLRGQLVTEEGQAVIVVVKVVKIVEVVSSESPTPPPTALVAEGEDACCVIAAPLLPVTSATGQTVVETTRVSVVRYVVFDLSGQLVTEEGHAVMVAVRVLNTVEVVKSEPLPWPLLPAMPVTDGEVAIVWVAPAASVTGQIVVDTTMVSVVTKVVLELAGQFGTVEGQAVMVAVRVERIVDVVNCGVEDPVAVTVCVAMAMLEWGPPVGIEPGAETAMYALGAGLEAGAEDAGMAPDEEAEHWLRCGRGRET